jgi:hypothetical protein
MNIIIFIILIIILNMSNPHWLGLATISTQDTFQFSPSTFDFFYFFPWLFFQSSYSF